MACSSASNPVLGPTLPHLLPVSLPTFPYHRSSGLVGVLTSAGMLRKAPAVPLVCLGLVLCQKALQCFAIACAGRTCVPLVRRLNRIDHQSKKRSEKCLLMSL